MKKTTNKPAPAKPIATLGEDDFTWVRGVSTGTAAHGIAFHDGRLCEVIISDRRARKIQPVKYSRAAKTMKDLLQSEINLGLDVLATDDGWLMWLDGVSTVCAAGEMILTPSKKGKS